MSSETLRQAAARLSSGRTSTTVDLESQQPSSSSYSSASPFDFFSHIGTSISSGVSGGVGGWFSTNKDQEEEQISYFSGMFTLTRQQRMYGFVMCLALGLLCIFIACMMLPSILITSRKVCVCVCCVFHFTNRKFLQFCFEKFIFTGVDFNLCVSCC